MSFAHNDVHLFHPVERVGCFLLDGKDEHHYGHRKELSDEKRTLAQPRRALFLGTHRR